MFFELFKPKTTSDILLVWGRKRSSKFVGYFEILIIAEVLSNALLFAFGWQLKLKKISQSDYVFSKSSIAIGRSISRRRFLPFLEQLRNKT